MEVAEWFAEGRPDVVLRWGAGGRLGIGLYFFKCPYGHPVQKLTGIEIDSFLIKSNHIHLGEPLLRVMQLAHSCGPHTSYRQARREREWPRWREKK